MFEIFAHGCHYCVNYNHPISFPFVSKFHRIHIESSVSERKRDLCGAKRSQTSNYKTLTKLPYFQSFGHQTTILS